MKSALTKYRETHGKTLQALGEQFGVNKSTVLRWEENGVPLRRVKALAKALDIPPKLLRPDLARVFAD